MRSCIFGPCIFHSRASLGTVEEEDYGGYITLYQYRKWHVDRKTARSDCTTYMYEQSARFQSILFQIRKFGPTESSLQMYSVCQSNSTHPSTLVL